jgi:TM2 domain-containing membrane protein YozV
MTSACPYCRTPFEPEEPVVTCEACSTPHHEDCYAENGGCTVFGCAKAPADDPAISVTTQEIATPTLSPIVSAPQRPTPPPPPRAGASTAVPPPPRLGSAEGVPGAPIYVGFSNDTTRYITPPRVFSFAGYNETAPTMTPSYLPRRSRLTYILLGVLLGAFGGHNFYAGYTKKAVIQLLLTLLSCFFGGVISWIWAIVEVCTVTQDDDGVAFI